MDKSWWLNGILTILNWLAEREIIIGYKTSISVIDFVTMF
jgi:hypothetical protein